MLFSPEPDLAGAKKSVIAAKGFIDLAAEHPDTKEWDKMFWYKGEIYSALSMLLKEDASIAEISSDDAINTALTAFEMGMKTGKKYKVDIRDAANEKRSLFLMLADKEWKAEKYSEAGEAYDYGSRFSSSIGTIDTTVIYYAGAAYENAEQYEDAARMYDQLAKYDYQGAKGATLAASVHKKLGNTEKSTALLKAAQSKFPNDKDVLLGLVNAYIDADDAVGAEKALADAIATDPKNEKLHYNSGTIYINIGDQAKKDSDAAEDDVKKAELQEKSTVAYGKAETALNKALELKPDYVDAQYQLGAHLYNWASQLREQAAFLKVGDPREEKLNAMAEQKMDSAISALEKYIESEPNDKGILRILWKAYHKKGNAEKAKEYKARLDAAN
jgi:DNA-binding SARP family transcriptional activator